MPIDIIREKEGLAWRLTPWVFGGAAAAKDLAQGAGLYGGGVSSALGFSLGQLKLVIGNQLSYSAGSPIGYTNLDNFEQTVSQFILTNGVTASYPITDWLDAFGGVAYAAFLKDAYTSGYWEPEAGLRVHVGVMSLSASWIGYYGDGFNATGGRATLGFSW
jgi:hypothetical protein